MSSFSRRDFLKSTTMSFALLAGSASILGPLRQAWAENPTAANELLAVCSTINLKDLEFNPMGVTVSNPGSVGFLEVSSGKSFSITTPFLGHTVSQNPKQPYRVATFEKWGRRGALLDLNEKSIVAHAEPAEGSVFFGHAVFASGGSVLANTEDSYDRSNGNLALRDPASLKLIQKISSYGVRPHECRLAGDDKTILVVNGCKNEHHSNISWIDVGSGRLLHQVMADYDADLVFSHIDVSHDGWLCVGGGIEEGDKIKRTRIAFVSPEGKVMKPKIPADFLATMKGEGLSVAFLGKSGLVAVTVRRSDMVVVFDYKTQEFAGSVKIAEASGVVADLAKTGSEPAMIVSSGKDMDVLKVELPPGNKTPDASVLNASFGGNGSHLTRLYI